MGENIDQMKGTAKEKAGQLKDDPDLEAEGKRDQAKGDLRRASTTPPTRSRAESTRSLRKRQIGAGRRAGPNSSLRTPWFRGTAARVVSRHARVVHASAAGRAADAGAARSVAADPRAAHAAQ